MLKLSALLSLFAGTALAQPFPTPLQRPPQVSLLDIGGKAFCDGVHDDSELLAYATALVGPSATIVFPANRTCVGKMVLLLPNQRLHFQANAWLKCPAAAGNCKLLDVRAAGITITGEGRSGGLDGNRTAVAAAGGTSNGIVALASSGASDLTVEGIALKGFQGDGVSNTTTGIGINTHGVQNLVIRSTIATNCGGTCYRGDATGAVGRVAGLRFIDNEGHREAETVQSAANVFQYAFKNDTSTANFLLDPIIRGNHAYASTSLVITAYPVSIFNGMVGGKLSDNTCSGGWYCDSWSYEINTSLSNNSSTDFQKAGLEISNATATVSDGFTCDAGVTQAGQLGTANVAQVCVIADGVNNNLVIQGTQSLNMAGQVVNVTSKGLIVDGYSITSNVANISLANSFSTSTAISGTNLAISGVLTGPITVGDKVKGQTVQSATHIVSGSGNNWVVDVSQMVTSRTLTYGTAPPTNGLVGLKAVVAGMANAYMNGTFVVSATDTQSITFPLAHADVAFTIDAGTTYPLNTNIIVSDTLGTAAVDGAGGIELDNVQGFAIKGLAFEPNGHANVYPVTLTDSWNGAITGVQSSAPKYLALIKGTMAETIDFLTFSGISLANPTNGVIFTNLGGATMGTNNAYCGVALASAATGPCF